MTDLDGDDDRVRAVQHDTLADPLDSLHDDFMELWLQYGHVFLFAAGKRHLVKSYKSSDIFKIS